jgi:membrane protease YdiL (CAAX protease family)
VYFVASALTAPDAFKLALWVVVISAAIRWFHVTGGQWLDPRHSITSSLLRAFGLLVAAIVVLWGLAELLNLLLPSDESSSFKSALPSMSVPAVITIIGLRPVVEEVLFRGFLYDLIARRGTVVAVVGTTVLFCLGHWVGQQNAMYALTVLPLGLALGVLRALSRGLATPTAFHVAMNAILT